MTLIEEAEAMAVDALERCVDWDGSTMPDGAEPRRIHTCGELRDQAALLRRMIEQMRGEGV